MPTLDLPVVAVSLSVCAWGLGPGAWGGRTGNVKAIARANKAGRRSGSHTTPTLPPTTNQPRAWHLRFFLRNHYHSDHSHAHQDTTTPTHYRPRSWLADPRRLTLALHLGRHTRHARVGVCSQLTSKQRRLREGKATIPIVAPDFPAHHYYPHTASQPATLALCVSLPPTRLSLARTLRVAHLWPVLAALCAGGRCAKPIRTSQISARFAALRRPDPARPARHLHDRLQPWALGSRLSSSISLLLLLLVHACVPLACSLLLRVGALFAKGPLRFFHSRSLHTLYCFFCLPLSRPCRPQQETTTNPHRPSNQDFHCMRPAPTPPRIA